MGDGSFYGNFGQEETAGMTGDGESSEAGSALADLESSRLSREELLRRAAAAAAVVGVGPLLAGAAAQAAPSRRSQEKVTLDFWKFDDSGADPAIKKVINQWNKQNPNIQVKLKTFPFGPYLDTVLPTAFAGGRGPDVFWISAGNLLQYVNQGVLEPVNKMVNPRRKDFVPIVLKQTTVKGDVVTVPFELTPLALYYRKDILRAAGVAPPRNWRQLMSAAEKLTTSKQYGVVVEPAQGTYQWFTFMPFIWMTGAETMNAQWTKSMLLPRAAAAFQLWGDLIRKGYAPKKLAAISADIGPMGRGEAAMHVSGYWSKAQLEAAFPKVSWGVVPLPPPPGRKSVSVGGGWMQAINSEGDNVEEALAFTEWMWFKHSKFSHDWSCVANSEFSSRYSVNRGCSKIQSGPVDKFFRNMILPTARPEPRYPDQIVKAIGDGLQAAMFGGKSGAEAAKIAVDGINKYLKTYKGERVGR